jgi:hypothetical protein
VSSRPRSFDILDVRPRTIDASLSARVGVCALPDRPDAPIFSESPPDPWSPKTSARVPVRMAETSRRLPRGELRRSTSRRRHGLLIVQLAYRSWHPPLLSQTTTVGPVFAPTS